MKEFAFTIPTRIRYGEGVSAAVGPVIKELKQPAEPNVMVVTDRGIVAAGLLDRPLSCLKDEGIQYTVFDAVEQNPRDATVHEGADEFLECKSNCMIAIGGGSVIDCAKAIGVIASHGGKISDYEGWGLVPGPTVPLIAIPTTAGTASEVTFWSIITNSETHVKMGIGDVNIAASVALVDPVMTHSLPRILTIGTGLDALTHAIEAYICKAANPVSDALALKAIHLIYNNLAKVAENPDDDLARDNMMLGSLIAGISFANADVASVHCLSESIGGLYDAPHGILNGILLPYAMSYNAPTCADRLGDIAVAMGRERDAQEAVSAVMDLNRSLDVPALAEFNIKREHVHKLARMSADHGCNAVNPRTMKEDDYVKLIEAALEERLPE